MGPIGSSCPAHQTVPPCEAAKPRSSINSANGIRTRVWALRGPRPSPLDDSAVPTTNCKLHCDLRINLEEFQTALRSANQPRRIPNCIAICESTSKCQYSQFEIVLQARTESNT